MSCNTKTSLAAVIDAVNAQLNNNYVDRDDPRINQGVFTEPTIRGGLMLDEAAKLDFCGYVTECGHREPFGKQWVDRPLYPHNTLVSYEDGGEIKSRWQDIDDVVAGSEIGESYTTYEETIRLGLQGYVTIDSFELGATINQRNEALRHEADGKLYRWAGDLPKVIPANSTPLTAGGLGSKGWIEVSDSGLRQQLKATDGANLVSAVRGVLNRTVLDYIKDGLPSVFDYIPLADQVLIRAGTLDGQDATATTAAIQKCLDDNNAALFPEGNYLINKSLHVKKPRYRLAATGKATLWTATDFTDTTVNGEVQNALIHVEPNIPKADGGWMLGGTIDGIDMGCNSRSSGICHVRTIAPCTVRDCDISFPKIGIDDRDSTWGHYYNNVYIRAAREKSVKLNGACNGTHLNNCYLYGEGSVTPEHLYVSGGSYGVKVTGGYIEGAVVGATIEGAAQVSFDSVDFEIMQLIFIQFKETGSNVSRVSGCTFVDGIGQGGVIAYNAIVQTDTLNFIPLGDTSTIPAVAHSGTGYISTANNNYGNFHVKETGNIYNSVNGGGLKFSTTPVKNTNPTVLDEYRETFYLPELQFGGVGTGVTYAVQYGFITTVGNLHTCGIKLNTFNLGTGTGDASITLPRVASATFTSGIVRCGGLTTGDKIAIASISDDSQRIELFRIDGTRLTKADFTDNENNPIEINCTWFTS